jgi:hypothetical protein
LTAILGQLARVDSQAAVLLGAIVAMLAVLGANAPPLSMMDRSAIFGLVPLLLLLASLQELYGGAFPRLEGGQQSLVYFKEIAARTESRFIAEFRSVNADWYLDDLLGQVWRNSEILALKFQHLRMAFQLLAWALVPWLATLLLFAGQGPAGQRLLVK